MTKITIETETIITELTPSEASAKIKEALGIAEWPLEKSVYWFVDDIGTDVSTWWDNNDIVPFLFLVGQFLAVLGTVQG